ncbi:P2Y purinoceptor 2-like [Aplochiton taeniatus]
MNSTVSLSPLALNSTGQNYNASGSCMAEPQHISISVFLCLVLLLGFLLNSFSLWVFCCRMPQWSTGTVLQFHLALSDAIVTPTAPMMAAYFAMGNHWPFGRFMCQLKISLLSSHFYGSIIFLTLISFHRYMAVVNFNRRSRMKDKKFVQRLCGGVWLLLLIKSLVYCVLLPSSKEGTNNQCLTIHQKNLTNLYFTINFFIFIFGFLLPFSVSAVCYSRLASLVSCLNINTSKGLAVKVKSQRMIGVCLLIFGLCFLPLNVVRTIGVVIKKYFPNECHTLLNLETAYYVSLIFAGVNCCLDPLLYCFGSQTFCNSFQSFRIGQREGQNESESVEDML